MFGEPLLLVLCAVGFCALGVIGALLLNAFSILFDLVGGLLGLLWDVLTSGPIGWCGCALVVGTLCGIVWFVSFLLSVLPNCGTAEAINLCRLFGY